MRRLGGLITSLSGREKALLAAMAVLFYATVIILAIQAGLRAETSARSRLEQARQDAAEAKLIAARLAELSLADNSGSLETSLQQAAEKNGVSINAYQAGATGEVSFTAPSSEAALGFIAAAARSGRRPSGFTLSPGYNGSVLGALAVEEDAR